MSARRSAPARAKVNLVLEVTGRRPDGYHEIDTILQEIALSDTVTLEHGPEEGVVVGGPFRAGVPESRDNLAWRAAEALARRAGRSLSGLVLHLRKEIPPAAGLGGGSADAVAVLRLLAGEWGLDESEIRAIAAEIGSDTLFFLVGGLARAEGRGDRVTSLPPLPAHDIVLFVPRLTIAGKTARLFEALGRLPFDPGGRAAAFAGERPQRLRAAALANSFEKVAFEVFAGLAELRRAVTAAIGEPVRLAGAGPALFWIGPPGLGPGIANRARGLDCTVIATRTWP